MACVISVANQKGGVGKTTTVIELCTIFAKKGYKVLGIDLDGQRNFSIYAGADIDNKNTIFNALDAVCKVEDAVQTLNNYDIMISDSRLSLAQKYFIDGDSQFLLSDILGLLEEHGSLYDYVFIDCPPQRGILQEMAIVASDYIIGVTKVDDGGLYGLLELAADVELKTKRKTSHVKFLGILYNDYMNTREDETTVIRLDKIAEKIGTTAFETIIRHSIKASTCKKKRISITELDSNNNVAQDYAELADEIIKKIGG